MKGTAVPRCSGPAHRGRRGQKGHLCVRRAAYRPPWARPSSAIASRRERPDLIVTNTSVDNIPADADVVVCQQVLADRARASAPQAHLVAIGNFLADPGLDGLYRSLTEQKPAAAPQAVEAQPVEAAEKKRTTMTADCVKLGLQPVSKEEAIRAAGRLLVEQGCVDEAYIDAMLEREKLVTTYMGMGIAIPHGTTEQKARVKKSGIVMLQYPEGVDFGEEKAQLVFGIAVWATSTSGLAEQHLHGTGDEEVLEQPKDHHGCLLCAQVPGVPRLSGMDPENNQRQGVMPVSF